MEKKLKFQTGNIYNLYEQLAHFVNTTRDSLCVYLKLYFINDQNSRILVILKMLGIFKLNLRSSLIQGAEGPSRIILAEIMPFIKG